MDSLNGVAHGRYRVRTQTSSYVLDLDSNLFVRERAEADAAELRGDSEPAKLLEIIECTVGFRMLLRIDLSVHGVPWTIRNATVVGSIEEITVAPPGDV